MSKPTGLNYNVIKQWKADLVMRDGVPRFNMDYPIIEHEGSPDDATRFEGDPGLFLAWHFGIDNKEIESDTKLSEWMADRSTEEIITRFTGIPADASHELLNPEALWKKNYPTRKLTPFQFIAVLDLYLETGMVLWEKVLMDDPKFRVSKEDLPNESAQPTAT